ncbi:hypothetical protein, partial [Caulobacter sp. HMWF009]|uniref:hypothetical protein n=1 Tax=Caulobacter sp. HMWF009 TaxID=2056846 RepID=UPI001E3A9E06
MVAIMHLCGQWAIFGKDCQSLPANALPLIRRRRATPSPARGEGANQSYSVRAHYAAKRIGCGNYGKNVGLGSLFSAASAHLDYSDDPGEGVVHSQKASTAG